MPNFAMIAADFVRANKYFMGQLPLQQQKIWFVPFLAVSNEWYNDNPYRGEIVIVPLEEIRSFLSSDQSNKEMKRTVTKAFAKFDILFTENNIIPPFGLQKVEKGYAYFELRNPRALSDFRKGRQYYKFKLDEISTYKSATTIPLLWYCLSHRHLSREQNCWEIFFGDRELKMVLGYGNYEYLYIPGKQRNFYIDVENYIMESNANENLDFMPLLEKYNISDKELLQSKFDEIKKEVHFKRWDFEQKVLLPAINELNGGTMLKFGLQSVWKRSKNQKEKATKEESYIGKNYTLIDGNKSFYNYRRLERGKQYKFRIEI